MPSESTFRAALYINVDHQVLAGQFVNCIIAAIRSTSLSPLTVEDDAFLQKTLAHQTEQRRRNQKSNRSR